MYDFHFQELREPFLKGMQAKMASIKSEVKGFSSIEQNNFSSVFDLKLNLCHKCVFVQEGVMVYKLNEDMLDPLVDSQLV